MNKLHLGVICHRKLRYPQGTVSRSNDGTNKDMCNDLRDDYDEALCDCGGAIVMWWKMAALEFFKDPFLLL